VNKLLLACSGIFVLAVASCAQSGPGSTPGAAGSSGGDSSQGSAGTMGSAGNGVAGTTGSGGDTTPGTAGTSNPGTAGNGSAGNGTAGDGSAGNGSAGNGSAGNGSAGNGSAGNGSAGNGSAGNGAAGRGGSGGSAGSGGSTAGRGGSGGTTGAAGSTAGRGGSGGAAGAAGGTGGTDLMAVAVPLDGYLWEGTCSGNVTATGRNCPFYTGTATTCAAGTSWDNRGTIKTQTLKMNGTPGVAYTVNFEVRGVVGTRCYTGGTIASTAVPSSTGANNAWYVGGRQYNDSIWNTYEIHVSPSVTGQANVFYANAFGTDAVNTSWCQKEATYAVSYMAKLPVMGDSTLTFTIHDTNCQAQQNCGSDDTSSTCNMMRTIDLSGLSPAATFAQPRTNIVGTRTYYPQWLYFDVKSVTSP
jgi:hypothetical protein